MSAVFYFPILKNGKSRLFLLRVSNSKVLNAERIREFHCERGVRISMPGKHGKYQESMGNQEKHLKIPGNPGLFF